MFMHILLVLGYIIILKIPYVIRVVLYLWYFFPNFLLLWVLKIQKYFALYNLHYEYVTFSCSVRDLPPLKNIIKEEVDNLVINSDNLEFLSSSTVYEDNNYAIVVSKSPSTSPTSKHVFVYYHWLRQHIGKELFLILRIRRQIFSPNVFRATCFYRLGNLYSVCNPSDDS